MISVVFTNPDHVMWLLIQIISTGNCFLKALLKKNLPSPPNPPYRLHFTSFHIISHFDFDFFLHPEISPKHRASISSRPRGLPQPWRRPRPPPPAAPGRSPRGLRPLRSAARWRRLCSSRPRRRAPSAAGAGPRRGDRWRPPGGCRCRLGGPRAAPGGHRWKGRRGHNGDPKNRGARRMFCIFKVYKRGKKVLYLF